MRQIRDIRALTDITQTIVKQQTSLQGPVYINCINVFKNRLDKFKEEKPNETD